jgi:hypothetical protein
MNSNNTNIDEIIQLMRALKISQIRRQLEFDAKTKPDRVQVVLSFFKAAEEQSK